MIRANGSREHVDAALEIVAEPPPADHTPAIAEPPSRNGGEMGQITTASFCFARGRTDETLRAMSSTDTVQDPAEETALATKIATSIASGTATEVATALRADLVTKLDGAEPVLVVVMA